MTVNVSRASTKDAEEIAGLFNQYLLFYKQPSNIEAAKQYITTRIERNESVIFMVREKGVVHGFVQLYPSFSSISLRRTWILNDLYVEESARRRGIGQSLLDKVRQFAVETEAVSISLQTAPTNQTAQALYERNGYIVDQTYLNYSLSL